jgi:AsmA protein
VNGVVAAAGESAEIAAWIGRPVELLRGRKSDLSLRVREPRVSFSFNGAMDQTPAPVIEGSFTGSIPDLRKLADAFDRALPLPGPLRGAALAGALRLGPKSLSLSNLRLSIDGNAYEGAIAFDADRDRPLLSGTLATDALDAAPFTADIPRLVEANGEWGRMRFPPPAEGALDVDLRLSATRARLGRAQLREAAFTLRSEPGRLAVTLEEAKAWNGLVKAQVSARPSASAYALRAVATLARVDAAAMLGEVFRTPRVSGEMNGEIDFSTEGDTLGRALRGLSGMARIAVNKGDVAGLDLEQALRRLEKRPLSVASEVRSGRTGFDAIDLDLALEAGRASVRRLQARGAGVAFDIKGSIDVPERALDLKLEARQASEAAQASAQGPWLSMDIRGLWNEPELTLDARSLISRSQAAEPLLRGMPTPSDAGANR